MACTRHFMNVEWEHHTWRPEVVGEHVVHSRETTMWGGSVNQPYMLCQKHLVCEVCGKVTETRSCACDPEFGEHCDVRLQWITTGRHQAE